MKLNFEDVDRHIIALMASKSILFEEAKQLLNGSKLVLEANEKLTSSYSLQVAFVTCYNISNRIFKGGVKCILPENTPNLLKLKGETFNDVLNSLFEINENVNVSDSTPRLLFGKTPQSENEVEIICSGWQGGLNFFKSEHYTLDNAPTSIPLGALLASSYGLFWAFDFTFEITNNLQNESFGYSLWDNSLDYNWNESIGEGPNKVKFPPKIWLVGLGHLGQAYLWTLLHFKNDFEVLLQDFDKLGAENLGSQIISFEKQIGKHKTRICADFLDNAGISNKIIEKRFISSDQKDDSLMDYQVLLTGLDSASTRSIIEPSRFKICLDGATNGKLENFDSFTFRDLNLLKKKPNEIWNAVEEKTEVLHENLYNLVSEKGGCGVLTNFGISTPFVGLFGACILISELLKSINEGRTNSIFSGKMRNSNSYNFV
ncbi:MAG: ThiF family adenylyltransferase [Bacteroidetes bacterium]|nr:ThiF family adenylyltransferase [Bacteroidota bacterium]